MIKTIQLLVVSWRKLVFTYEGTLPNARISKGKNCHRCLSWDDTGNMAKIDKKIEAEDKLREELEKC